MAAKSGRKTVIKSALQVKDEQRQVRPMTEDVAKRLAEETGCFAGENQHLTIPDEYVPPGVNRQVVAHPYQMPSAIMERCRSST